MIRKTAMKYREKFKKPEFGDTRRAYGFEKQRRKPIASRRTPQISFVRSRRSRATKDAPPVTPIPPEQKQYQCPKQIPSFMHKGFIYTKLRNLVYNTSIPMSMFIAPAGPCGCQPTTCGPFCLRIPNLRTSPRQGFFLTSSPGLSAQADLHPRPESWHRHQ